MIKLEEKAVHDFIEVYPRMLSPKFCMDLINYGKKVWLDSTRTGQNKMVRKKKITDDNQVMLAPNLNNLSCLAYRKYGRRFTIKAVGISFMLKRHTRRR